MNSLFGSFLQLLVCHWQQGLTKQIEAEVNLADIYHASWYEPEAQVQALLKLQVSHNGIYKLATHLHLSNAALQAAARCQHM